MDLIICLVLGVFAGWLSAAIEEVDEGVLARMGIGFVGGLIGCLATMMFDSNATKHRFTLLSLLLTIIAVSLLLSIFRWAPNYKSRDSNTA